MLAAWYPAKEEGNDTGHAASASMNDLRGDFGIMFEDDSSRYKQLMCF